MEKEEIDNVVEWKIQNVSCWSLEVHGKKIKSSFCSIFESEIKLYPRGRSGEEEYLAIRIKSALEGDLTFFGPDGVSMWTTEISIDGREGMFEPLAKFEDVVPRRNDPSDEDYVVLRFRLDSVESPHRSKPEGNVFTMCTTIDVFTVSLNIVPKLTRKDTVAVIKYSFKKCGEEDSVRMCLKKGVTAHDGKTKLQLEPFMTLGPFSVRSSIDLLDRDGDLVSHEENEHLFRNTKPWTVSNSLKLAELEEFDFTILLRLKIVYDNMMEDPRIFCISPGVRLATTSNPPSEEKPPKSNNYGNSTDALAKDFSSLYQNQDLSDLQISCGNASFSAHRCVLSARSPVFKEMLSSDSINIVKVDMDALTLSRFLTFSYSGSVDDLQWESAIMLYNAAQKYQVHTLKKACVSVLCASVAVSNVCGILLCADEHKVYQITTAVHEFISNNFSKVLGSDQWQRYTKTHSNVLLKTVNQLAGEALFKKQCPQ